MSSESSSWWLRMDALRLLCWVPIATLTAVELSVGQFDDWGAWAAAPIFLVPGLVSLVVVIIGLFVCGAAQRSGKLGAAGPMYLVIAGLPLIWLLVRRLVM